jgi:type I restriction enzyme S subunit
MSSELPEGWSEIALGNFIESMANGVYKPDKFYTTTDGVPCLRMYNIQDGQIVLHNVKRMRLSPSEVEQYQLLPGDLLVNRVNSRELVGKAAICPAFQERTVFESKNIRARLKSATVDPCYVNFFLLTGPARQQLTEGSKQTVGMATVSQPQLRALIVPFPALTEQQRIVAKVEALLARVNAARQRLAKVPAILKRFRQSVLAAACSGRLTADWREQHDETEPAAELLQRIAATRAVDNCHAPTAEAGDGPADFPEGWAYTTLGFLAEPSLRGRPFVTSGSRGWADRVAPQGPYFIRSENINTESLRLEDAIRVNAPPGAESERTRVEPGDLLLTITGNNVGRTAVVRDDCPPAHVSQHVAIIRVTPRVSVRFLWLWLRSEKHGQGQLRADFYGYTKPGLNLDQVKGVWIALPAVQEQHEIVRRVEALFRLADAIEKRVAAATAQAEKLTQAILAKAFRGELVPTEAELARREGRSYEPASVLLDRIRAERAASPAPQKRPARCRKP